jgi:ABC-type Na+ efflux pump permease subunit
MFKIAAKDLRLFFADRKAVMLTFLLPIGLITLFVFAFGGTGRDGGMSEMEVYVADDAQTDFSQSLVAKLDSLPELRVVPEASWENTKNNIRKGKLAAALHIPAGFEDSLKTNKAGFEFLYDPSKATEASIVQGILFGKLFAEVGNLTIPAKVRKDLQAAGITDSLTLAGVSDMVGSMMKQDTDPLSGIVRVETITSAEETNPALIQAVSGTAVMTLLFSVAAMGGGLLEEKEKGTLKKLLMAPVTPAMILFGKLISAICIGSLQLSIMMVVAWLFFGLNIWMNIPALVLTIFFTALCCGAFGMFIASIATSRKQVDGYSTIIVLVMSAIGGSMIPTFVMPEIMQKMSMFSVNYWSIQAFYDIYWRDFSWAQFGFRILVMGIMSAGLIGLSLPLFKRNILRVF